MNVLGRAFALAAGLTACLVAACGSNTASSGAPTPPGSDFGTASTPSPSLVPTSNASSTSSAESAGSGTADRCAGRTFGAGLQPKDQPADVHVYSAPPAMQIDSSRLYQATVTTQKGTIVLCLDPALAPNTVNNFVVLARNHYFDGLTFHRVVPGFVIQGGDPTGSGSGGPGYKFADEPVKGSYAVGSVAMANAGPNTNGSQFFICIGPQCAPLPPKYSLFGRVHSGQDAANSIAQRDVMTTVTVAESTS